MKSTILSRGAVIYTRVSTGEQAKHGTSLDSQLDACRAKAAALNLPIVAEYEDAGISGGLLHSRVGMQAALADISDGRADTLICANVSRYSRDVEHQQRIMKDVRTVGGRVVFCDMEFDDTPEGDLAFNIMGGFAQYEKQLIKSRSMKGKRKRAEEGQQPQRSSSAYGYHIVTNAEVECGVHPAQMRGRYIVVDEQAKIVQELFARYAQGGIGLAALTKGLNVRGIPSPRGGHWNPMSVSIILRNPVYKGEPAYGRTSRISGEATAADRHMLTGKPLVRSRVVRRMGQPIALVAPELVSAELWEQVQAGLKANQSKQGGNPARARMLSGRVVCPCGHNAVLVGRTGNKYYQCSKTSSSKLLFGEAACKRSTFNVLIVEQSVIASLLDAVRRPDAITAAISAYNDQTTTTPRLLNADAARSERNLIDTALIQLADEETAAVQAQIAGIRCGASPDAYASIFADIAARRKDLEDRRGIVAKQISASPAKTTGKRPGASAIETKALNDVALALSSDAVAGEHKRDVVATVIEKVVCRPDGADVYFLPGLGAPTQEADQELSDTLRSTLTELMQ